MMRFKNLLACLAILTGLTTSASPYIWVEKPQANNFNMTVSWPTASNMHGIAIMPDKPIPEQPFFEMAFENNGPAGNYYLWGRTFDPEWSSPARWRLDDGPWQEWKPGKRVDRKVWNRTFPLDWCSWGTVRLSKGKHSLRFELTGKRSHGDYHYFVQDALLLTLDKQLVPKGKLSPAEQARTIHSQIEKAVSALPENRTPTTDVLARAAKFQSEAESDTEAVDKLQDMLEALNKTIDDKGDKNLLHGRIEKLVVGDNISFEIVWNKAWRGRYMVAFTCSEALYAVKHLEAPGGSARMMVTVDVPENLPAGKITVTCLPFDTAFSYCQPAYFDVSKRDGKATARPSAWGVFRDTAAVAHPWYVSENNVLIWDGKPFIPFGGMMNTRVTWESKTGDAEGNSNHQYGFDIIKKRLQLLKQYGIGDVYYNGFFPHSNPNHLRKVVNITEGLGIKYGLSLANFPAVMSTGFYQSKAYTVTMQTGGNGIGFTPIGKKLKITPPARCIWTLTTPENKLLDCGIVAVHSLDSDTQVAFRKGAPKNSVFTYILEREIPYWDPVGYLPGIDEYIRKVRATYGGLKLGANFRFFIDPFGNEMHARPTAIPTCPEFRTAYGSYLCSRYATIANLNKIWNTSGKAIADFKTAARLIPIWHGNDRTLWLDPDTTAEYSTRTNNLQALRDLKEFRGKVCRDIINRMANVLKSIADVPVVVKHNVWFSDWFVNDRKTGGFDGVGMESYCYGDSLAYHNSAVVYGEVLQAARNQWCPVTESSAAAFEGQKYYCGYMDRLQMLHDVDQLMMLGAKGFYHFGFSFDPDPGRFFTTEITRDPRQLEWLASLAKIYRNPANRLLAYRPEMYGWYPAHLREREIVGGTNRSYDMDGNYMGRSAQIRMAPDGRWIIPALNPSSAWKGLLVAEPLLTPMQKRELRETATDVPRYLLTASGKNELDGFTSQGIGVVPASSNPDRLNEFRKNVLGYEVFQTETANAAVLPDKSIMLWTCVEKKTATITLPAGVEVSSLEGKAVAIKNNMLTLVRPEHQQLTKNRPSHLPNGYYYNSEKQPDVVIIKGVSKEEILKRNSPAYYRWLPRGAKPETVAVWCEAEHFQSTTFTQPSLVGYSRYSEGRAIGVNTHFAPPKGKHFETVYAIKVHKPLDQAAFWLRKMIAPTMDLAVFIDGKKVAEFTADSPVADAMHLTPWNAGLAKDNLKVGWVSADIGPVAAGRHSLTIRAKGRSREYKIDTKLMGGDAEKNTGVLSRGPGMRALQLDCFAIVAK